MNVRKMNVAATHQYIDTNLNTRSSKDIRLARKVLKGHQTVAKDMLTEHVPIEAQFGCGRCARSFLFVDEAKACFRGHKRAVRIMLNSIGHVESL